VAGDYLLRHRNVYVLPTRPGLVQALVIVAMLLASINYRLSLGYALVFLAIGVTIVAMLQTWRNLASLVLRPGRADPVFAGDFVTVTAIVGNPGRIERFALTLASPTGTTPSEFDLAAGTERVVSLTVPAPRRGWHPVPRLRLETRFPLGIWRAWSWWQPAIRYLAYPCPEAPGTPLPSHRAGAGEGAARVSGDEDLAALRPWRVGDSTRRIAWKAMARTASDAALVSDYEGGAAGELSLDWRTLPAPWDAERRLSRLTRWVLDADALGLRYALALPGCEIAASTGPAHRERCLEALATWGHGADASRTDAPASGQAR
jgi:uncharacterized protein (DUF58 family)